MSRSLSAAIALSPALLLLLFALTPGGEALGQWLLGLLLEWQRSLQRGLSLNMMQFSRQGDTATLLTLVGLSLGYGVFHAVGPGHGKAVISTYLLVKRAELSRGIRLTVAAALMQGLVAVVLVGVLVLGLGMLTRHAMANTVVVERFSYALVIVLGGWICLRALVRLWRLLRQSEHSRQTLAPLVTPPLAPLQPSSGAERPTVIRPVEAPLNHGPNCDCGMDHHVNPGQVAHDWRESLGVIVAIGMRPCTGAVMILGVAVLLGHWWTGVAAVLAMSLGTALTTSALACVTVLARGQALRLFTRAPAHWQVLLGQGVAVCGGLLIAALGIALLTHASAAATSIL